MTIKTRKEILAHVHERYKRLKRKDKQRVLDEFVLTTGLCRKYAIHLLKGDGKSKKSKHQPKERKCKYDNIFKQHLLTLWQAANKICSKRLVPFIPELLTALERFDHLSLSDTVKEKLCKISPATVDRLLYTERNNKTKGRTTTRSGNLLKKQINVRTFNDWHDVVPGFLEGDLVAHCGDNVAGSFLNTLVLTDIASTWTEPVPILKRSEGDVISALYIVKNILPFPMLGLDTDNGSEFINHGLINFCNKHKITFTRSRAYKKNDQAHVEERNGSIVRRLVGYDRYEGLEAYNALSKLYRVLRLYVNFFQPSLKLISKKRDGAKVTKKYDRAKTPYQRLISSNNISAKIKAKLTQQYLTLDPVVLLKDLERLQDEFWKYAWKTKDEAIKASDIISEIQTVNHCNNNEPLVRRYRKSGKPRKQHKIYRKRTRPDNFHDVYNIIQEQSRLGLTAKETLEYLIREKIGEYNMSHLRTMQRRVKQLKHEQILANQEKYVKENLTQNEATNFYTSLVAKAVINE